MAYLLASIVCSVLVSVLLKVARKQKINIEQAVAVNYIVAITLTMLVLKPDLSNPQVFFTDLVAFCGIGHFAAKRVCHYGQIGRCGRYRQIGCGATLIAVSADCRFIHAFP